MAIVNTEHLIQMWQLLLLKMI